MPLARTAACSRYRTTYARFGRRNDFRPHVHRSGSHAKPYSNVLRPWPNGNEDVVRRFSGSCTSTSTPPLENERRKECINRSFPNKEPNQFRLLHDTVLAIATSRLFVIASGPIIELVRRLIFTQSSFLAASIVYVKLALSPMTLDIFRVSK